jgi:excisionase family DNA binding protein
MDHNSTPSTRSASPVPTPSPSTKTPAGAARGPLSAFLTVEEAAEILRIGRTTAYALTREWRRTRGKSGLPVVKVGHKLRVPRRHLEKMAGGDLTAAPGREPGEPPARIAERSARRPKPTPAPTQPSAEDTRPTGTRRRTADAGQASLFGEAS